MDFFADERFVKPELCAAVAIRVQLPLTRDDALRRAVGSSLNDEQEDTWPIMPSRTAAYFAALAFQNPSVP